MRNLKIMMELMKFGAKPCGSFYVLGDETPDDSDADFYILESQVREFEAKFLPDFFKENFTNYSDRFTVGLYVYEAPKVGFTSTADKSNRIEVTVKKDEYEEAYLLMWSMLAQCPEIFKAKLWKRSGVHREVIKERIEHMLLALK
jgi:hypothetical protein